MAETVAEFRVVIDFPEGPSKSDSVRTLAEATGWAIEEEGAYPVRIESRTVTYTDWEDIADA